MNTNICPSAAASITLSNRDQLHLNAISPRPAQCRLGSITHHGGPSMTPVERLQYRAIFSPECSSVVQWFGKSADPRVSSQTTPEPRLKQRGGMTAGTEHAGKQCTSPDP
ncbi:hypothetical protein KUCAC02_016918 [Chaenocephalus aceratus]|nr:hypothetical protein KUCAC02_016918 [Chaenocephalus aceratus]